MNTVIYGALEAYFETGTEGVIWSVYEDGDKGYDGLHCLKNGDNLKVFNKDGSFLWEGIINLNYKTRYRSYPLNPEYGQQEVLGYWVHGLQVDVEPEAWGKMFFDRQHAELRSKNE